MSENQTSDLQSVQDTVSSVHSTTTSDTASQLSEEEKELQDDIISMEADSDLDETLENAEMPNDALLVELSDILSLASLDEQIQTLALIMPFVKKLSKDCYACMQEWWDNTYSGDLDPILLVYMNDILLHMNTIFSQM